MNVRVRILLARMSGDTEPTVCAAVDEIIWENWNDQDEASWMAAGKKTWGIDQDTEFKVVWAEFSPQELVDAFDTPVVRGSVRPEAAA